jgi:hypothetical protein
MATPEEVAQWRRVVARLLEGPPPRGEQFHAARALLHLDPAGPTTAQALRVLLEGAMADATTDVADAQSIMRLLKALDRAEITVEQLCLRR